MTTLKLRFEKGHLLAELPDGSLWLADTGAPKSMGTGRTVTVAGVTVRLQPAYLGVSLKQLRKWVGVDFSGLLGLDVLGRLDAVFDLPAGTVTFSKKPDLAVDGTVVSVRNHGVPTLTGWVRGRPRPWLLDTGAQLSYFLPQEDDLSVLPFAGRARDFFPVVGEYTVDTYRVPVTLGESNLQLKLRAAVPPRLLRLLLSQWGGLVGSELFVGRQVGVFPLRHELVVGPRREAAEHAA
jgi:hypothetical protein